MKDLARKIALSFEFDEFKLIEKDLKEFALKWFTKGIIKDSSLKDYENINLLFEDCWKSQFTAEALRKNKPMDVI